MKFRIVVVGKAPAGSVGEAIAAFERRAARYWPLEVVEVRGVPARSRGTDGVRRLETQRVLEKSVGELVVLDERGRALSTEAFAAWMQERQERAGDVTFAIGGAVGLEPAVREQAALVLAVAHWTLSHDLARLVLAEQIYRAGTLRKGEPYHRA